MTDTGYLDGGFEEWWRSRQTGDAKEHVRLSAETGEWLQTLTGRDDLLVVVEPGAGRGAPAVYLPESATIELDPVVCTAGQPPGSISMATEQGRLASPVFAGAAAHEAGHDKYSKWPIDQDPRKREAVRAALLLEEAAMEGDLVAEHPPLRVLLRASFAGIVNAEGDTGIDGVAAAARLAALTHARVDAGVVEHAEAAPVIEACRSIVGERYEAFRSIWLAVQALPARDDAAVMEQYGQRWLDLLGDDRETAAADAVAVHICGEPRPDHDHDHGGGVLADVAAAVTASAETEAAAAAEKEAVRAAAAAARAAAADARKTAEAAAAVFDVPVRIGPSPGGQVEGIASQRPPTPAEHGHADDLAWALQRAQYRDRAVAVAGSTVPPGRLRGAQALKRSAERAMGLPPTAQPWRRKERRRTEQPPIRVGIGCDISGSMHAACRSAASAAWTVARAVHTVDGDTATVAYGEDVHAVVRPGEAPQNVRDFHANGGMENWVGAIRALNGALHLDDPSAGVRLAVFISDGHYTDRQRRDGEALMRDLLGSGAKVLWIGFGGTGWTGPDNPPQGAQYILLDNPGRMGAVIGDAMVALLEAA
jgi:hypothetical protein